MDDLNILNHLPQRKYVSNEIVRVANGKEETVRDDIIIEEPLSINLIYFQGNSLKKVPLSITMRTPGDDFDLVRGFLFTEGIIGTTQDILKMGYEKAKGESALNTVDVHLSKAAQIDPTQLTRHFYTSSSCGVCGKTSIEMVRQHGVYFLDTSFKISTAALQGLLVRQNTFQDTFDKTGGNHIAYLFDQDGTILRSQEDVGRHNAMDKLIGQTLTNEALPLGKYGILVSGRLSFELVQKAWLAGIPIVCAIGAPTSLAVSLADDIGMTLVGFLKQKSLNIYTHPNRIDRPL